MTQKIAATKYGCTRECWCQWETGSKGVSVDVLEKMAAVVGLEITVQTQEKKTWQPRKSD
jgi:DNA-binding XRE family transcriptional regulator